MANRIKKTRVLKIRRAWTDTARQLIEPLESRALFAAGQVDPTFADQSPVRLSQLQANFDGTELALAPDGKVVVAGYIGQSLALIRLNTDGSLDTTFSGDGIFTWSDFHDPHGVAVQEDGKIVVGLGLTTDYLGGPPLDFLVARFTEDGSVDSSFGMNGVASAGNRYPDAAVYDVAIQRDGKIYAIGKRYDAGSDPHWAIAAVRYDQFGQPDPSFDGDGLSIASYGSDENGYAASIDYSAGGSVGKLVVLGANSDNRLVLARFRTNGTLDSTFDGDGKLSLLHPDASTRLFAGGVTVLPDGQILIDATADRLSLSRKDLYVAKFALNGTLNTSFGNNGVTELAIGSATTGGDIAVGYLGNILVGGAVDYSNAIFGLTDTGNLDPRFSGDGIYTDPDVPYGGSIAVTDNAIYPARRIYTVGSDVPVKRVLDVGPVVTIATFSPVIGENNPMVPVSTSVIVARTERTDQPETVYLTTSGTALLRGTNRDVTTSGITIGNGTTTTTNVVIPAGQTFTSFTVTVLNDGNFEGDEFLTFGVYDTIPYDAGSPNSTTLTIRDDDIQAGPTVTNSTFNYDISPQRLTIQFDQDVASTIGDNDFQITGPAGIPAHTFSYSQAYNTVTLGFLGVIPSGDYVLKTTASGIKNAGGTVMPADKFFSFYFLAGDVNHDRVVNFDDLIILAQNYNKHDKTFGQGNLDYSPNGVVNFDDLIILAQQYGKSIVLPNVQAAALPNAAGDTTKRKDSSASRLSELA